ncbi:PREDICTED: uncharacterized protein LOC108564876 isoform X2 [Nicrophorus vespilloides]|uniref:Uncharacterized protein LOC108564876 isoform X2 n=1 Tax=Nicrophorus vespilloides TaxID=110193 RepID=A0ABM1MYA7_NICVS|nr:PREDICTED: uncharacterized protein LOC108564876 isoform X2 [Nicrophorus vespilloides]
MDVTETQPSNGFLGDGNSEFVTVVSVGTTEHINPPEDVSSTGYVTVLTIGEDESREKIEEVLVYRLPGERLGFGLKFEGGTKAAEFVKRLFIQSCAPDSPASRVRSSWGSLTEGDEVLEIDSFPVKSMTRIDCVRCLKDSNVVIKLLVKHNETVKLARSTEDLPLVISAEKKRTPPPPPPVPPRKIPRRLSKENIVVNQEPPVPSTRVDVKNRSSTRIPQPEVHKRDRKLSDGSNGPPDAELYVDLFSQESPYCLSESDDTGSSISTVVDRFSSFPTTTTSSFAGSLPSTPTAIQKQLDLSKVFYPFESDDTEDNYLFSKLISLQSTDETDFIEEPPIEKVEKPEVSPLQPPANFQDAPLSYGDEDVRAMEAPILNEMKPKTAEDVERRRPPPPPPRTKHQSIKEKNNNDYETKNEYVENLPRLVDFVPKSSKAETYETIRKFLENEQRSSSSYHYDKDNYHWGHEMYTYNWMPSTQLATIGEDEEESLIERNSPLAPIVIVENADVEKDVIMREDFDVPDGIHEPTTSDAIQPQSKAPEAAARSVAAPTAPVRSLTPPDAEVMEAPSINSRQPPDGHEFPDYQETPVIPKPIMSGRIPNPIQSRSLNSQEQQSTNKVRNMIAKFSTSLDEQLTSEPGALESYKSLSKSVMNMNTIVPSSLTNANYTLNNKSSLDLSETLPEKQTSLATPKAPRLGHMRSQSMINISEQKPKTDRWHLIAEQQRRSFSKLKGLIIPEHTDVDENVATVDLPEIKSVVTHTLPLTKEKSSPTNAHVPKHSRNSSTPSLTTPIWNSNNSNAIPKYSPAFKRKSLQIYGSKPEESKPKPQKQSITSQLDDESRLPVTLSLNEAPKSLESITSPTRSDCSFEYMSSSPELKATKVVADPKPIAKPKEETGRSEDESDNDSAVSSSQSSYISRNSPPVSPNHLQSNFPTPRESDLSPRTCGKYDLTGSELQTADSLNPRLLKPQSVEAINRKNILASAKCRSGRDLKVGSPLIQRKFDEEVTKTEEVGESPMVVEEAPPAEANGHKPKENKRPPTLDLSKILPRSTLKNNKTASVTDLRKNFEKMAPPSPKVRTPPITQAQPAQKPTTPITTITTKRNSLPSIPQVSVKSLDTKETTKIIVEAITNLDEPITKEEVKVINLCPEIAGGSIGITLAGGVDYETKEITVHKVRQGSPAHRDGRLSKGVRILSINGKTMKGLTHAESIAILKENVPEVVLVIYNMKEVATTPALTPSSRHSSMYDLLKIAPKDSPIPASHSVKQEEIVVTLVKDAASLGFSMEGGKESLQGDVPLVIKKLFTGGTADKCGKLKVGDEIIDVNGINVTNMPRIDVWSLMKKLPDGDVILKVRR